MQLVEIIDSNAYQRTKEMAQIYACKAKYECLRRDEIVEYYSN